MSEFATPIQRTPVRQSDSDSDTSKNIKRATASQFKSPQVLFDQTNGKHLRETPSSGRGLTKKIRSKLPRRTPNLTHKFASPSEIYTRSMLSFDLHGGVAVSDDQIPGESSLFVKFVKNRRRSDGRGSLRELINKRIALQTSGQVLALRKANDPKPPTELPASTSAQPPKEKVVKQSSKQKKTVRFHNSPSARQSFNSRKDLEIPLGQGDDEGVSEDPQLSETQQPTPTEELTQPLSQTQVWMGTQETVPEVESPHTSPSPSPPSEAAPSQRPRQRRPKNMFVDDEASDEDEEGGCDDESDGSNESDLSDLVASTPEDSDNDASGHAKLHMRWRQEVEDSFDPFDPKGKQREQVDERHVSRKDRILAAAKQVAYSPAKPPVKKVEEKPAAAPKPIDTVVPAWKNVTRKRAGPKRNPHRRSSVSSVDRFEINTTAPRGDQSFKFISAPSKAVLDSIERKHQLKTIAEESSAAPQRLMGTKRFVFGKT